ncbi:MAG: D-alanine--D-alanine ligase [Candidatus Komeilibacteria bacterium]|nr:D-alanine--D-alanine ligase [Candidatus Komeilibacteria bacterium]
MKIKIGILFGGQSPEHEVSVRSARNIVAVLNPEKYDLTLIGIDKQGRWFCSRSLDKRLAQGDYAEAVVTNESVLVALLPGGQGQLVNMRGEEISRLDVIFPVLHGPYGEDGVVQGYLRTAGVPYVGTGILGSAVGMDKDVMKRLLREANLPIANFIAYQPTDTIDFAVVKSKLGLPVFVKPANMGSSVGVSRVTNENELNAACREAFRYDKKIIIEEEITGREIECAVIGNENPRASLPGEIIVNQDYYSYKAKYDDSSPTVLKAPADLPLAIQQKIMTLAIQVFKTLAARGLARVDFFLRPDGGVIINEINTLPGFTSISMYPRMWDVSGLSQEQLVEELISLSLAKN